VAGTTKSCAGGRVNGAALPSNPPALGSCGRVGNPPVL
jgi:hypothetical protein